MRFDKNEKALAEINRLARTGEAIPQSLMEKLNGRLVLRPNRIFDTVSEKALFLCHTKKETEHINNAARRNLEHNGAQSLRIWAQHAPPNASARCGLSKRIAALSKCPAMNSDGYFKWLGTCRNFVDLCVGTRVRCLHNFCPKAGLYQGAPGTVVGFGLPPGRKLDDFQIRDLNEAAKCNFHCPVVYVKMDNVEGFESAWRDVEGVVAFHAKQTPSNADGLNRFMLPLLPAHARTYHSAQGLTAKEGAVIFPPKSKRFGLLYVGISRVKTLDGLHLMHRLTEHDFGDRDNDVNFMLIDTEMERLRNLRSVI